MYNPLDFTTKTFTYLTSQFPLTGFFPFNINTMYTHAPLSNKAYVYNYNTTTTTTHLTQDLFPNSYNIVSVIVSSPL